ncbi:MAG: 6,7-dimethyl-8-ribityllumazine synthase [Ignavibacteria bacterium]|nr:6,7-dimethyl-8-ribityllumazine synthase [Ignavibacteria bacterium]
MRKIEGNINSDLTRYARIAIIASKFNFYIVERLIKGAITGLEEFGIKEKDVTVVFVPGAFEIPITYRALCESKKYDGIIILGCVIKGETAHFEYVAGPVSDSINKLTYEYKMPTGFGLLTCYNDDQAFKRSEIDPPTKENNKGYEAALVALEIYNLLNRLY